MSSWKKASKVHQKTHKERHQPSSRQHLGLLEKKKDYLRRNNDIKVKNNTIKLLKERALNKNPDEFYHHMINSKVEDGMHFEKEREDVDSSEQIKLMKTQDLKYIVTKRTQELKKINKLQAQLHLSSVDYNIKNKHIYFSKNIDRMEMRNKQIERLTKIKLPDIPIEDLMEATKHKKKLYEELYKRIDREKELTIIQEKIELERHLENKTCLPPKKIKHATKNGAAIYKWQYERKK